MGPNLFTLIVTLMKKGFYTKLQLFDLFNKMNEWNINIVTFLMWHVLYVSKEIYQNGFGGMCVNSLLFYQSLTFLTFKRKDSI